MPSPRFLHLWTNTSLRCCKCSLVTHLAQQKKPAAYQAVLDAALPWLDTLADLLGVWLAGNVQVGIRPVIGGSLQLGLKDFV